MRVLWILTLLLETIHGTSDEADEDSCANTICHHDNVKVCAVREDESGEITFRLFGDACALQKHGCKEDKVKGFRSVNIDYCKQAFSANTFRRSAVNNDFGDETNEDGEEVNRDEKPIDIANSTHGTCVKCSYSSESNSICAIRPEGDHFIVRWFPDECHIQRYNCENNSNFTITDDYICIGHNENSENSITENIKNSVDEETESNLTRTLLCLQNGCIPDFRIICAIRPENKRFIVRWFADKCYMFEYNCEHHVNFSVTDNYICIGNDSSSEVYKNLVKLRSSDTDNIQNVRDMTDVLEIPEEMVKTTIAKDFTIKGAEGDELRNKWNNTTSRIPNKVVVSTFDLSTENIHETVKKFFAATHSTGIQLEKLGDMETRRRMIIKQTGPVNLFVPRTFRPANYTPLDERGLSSKEMLKYSPLVRYCYHTCPEKCPDIYKPVCLGRGGDPSRQAPFVYVKNHCYMDMAKCNTAAYTKFNKTSRFEEVGFLFCGGYKMMNMVYMFPLIRILQKMGRLRKKGHARFVMHNLGYFPEHIQG